jgi:hypothetical protein
MPSRTKQSTTNVTNRIPARQESPSVMRKVLSKEGLEVVVEQEGGDFKRFKRFKKRKKKRKIIRR